MPKYVVRTGNMRTLGVYNASKNSLYNRSEHVVVRTDRGIEMGKVLCEATEHALKNLQDPTRGQLLRSATLEDESAVTRLVAESLREFKVCQQYVEDLKLDMQLVDVEHILGGERIVFYYLAENRVDFRELVKKLASELQTRIEMRQIGVRDEAKLLADYGDCGKEVCCNTHLAVMPPVSMKMAKIQRATLDPTKISGRCGRLKCCLRYEYDTYIDLRKELPPIGAVIQTKDGQAKVLNQEIIAGQILVEMEDRRRVLINSDDVISVISRSSSRSDSRSNSKSDSTNSNTERSK